MLLDPEHSSFLPLQHSQVVNSPTNVHLSHMVQHNVRENSSLTFIFQLLLLTCRFSSVYPKVNHQNSHTFTLWSKVCHPQGLKSPLMCWELSQYNLMAYTRCWVGAETVRKTLPTFDFGLRTKIVEYHCCLNNTDVQVKIKPGHKIYIHIYIM